MPAGQAPRTFGAWVARISHELMSLYADVVPVVVALSARLTGLSVAKVVLGVRVAFWARLNQGATAAQILRVSDRLEVFDVEASPLTAQVVDDQTRDGTVDGFIGGAVSLTGFPLAGSDTNAHGSVAVCPDGAGPDVAVVGQADGTTVIGDGLKTHFGSQLVCDRLRHDPARAVAVNGDRSKPIRCNTHHLAAPALA